MGEYETLWAKAQSYEKEWKFSKAAKVYLKSAQIQLKIGAKERASILFWKAGRCLYKIKDWDGALKWSNKSLEIADQLKNLSGQLHVLTLIGNILHEKGDLYGAMDYYKESLNIAEQVGDLEMRAIILVNIENLKQRGRRRLFGEQ